MTELQQPKEQTKATKEMNAMLDLHDIAPFNSDQVIQFGQAIIQKYGPVDEAAGERFRKALA